MNIITKSIEFFRLKHLYAFALISFGITLGQGLQFPTTPTQISSDVYFDTTIIDEYRNLENVNSEETKKWIQEQNIFTRNYLDKFRKRENALTYIKDFKDYSYFLPYKIGENFYAKTSKKIYKYKDYNDLGRNWMVIADADKISQKDLISFNGFSPSKNEKYFAITFSRNGSDWNEIKVCKQSLVFLDDNLEGVRSSNVRWKDDGFFYISYKKREQFSADTMPQIYYHKLNTNQEQDLLIDKYDPKYKDGVYFDVTSDERYLFVYKTEKLTNSSYVYYIDLSNSTWTLKPFVERVKGDIEILDNHEGYLYAITNKLHENGTLVKIDPKEPNKWHNLTIPISNAKFMEARMFKNLLVCNVIEGTSNFFAFYDHTGKFIKRLMVPIGYSIGGFNGNLEVDETFFYLQSYFVPPVVYKMDLKSMSFEQFRITEVTYDHTQYKCEFKEYISKDSAKVPITIVYKKGTKLDGKNPTLLKSYGGYGSIHLPTFDPSLVYFLSKGGVFAYAHVRGEGNLGGDWALQGRRLLKQNCIDDFIDAAEFLIRAKYTSAQKLAITGGSHGGMLVAAAMVQRPDLFKLVIPEVGVYDMLRFEKFTVGALNTNIKEFGTVNIEKDFRNLLSYSPYHNIKSGVNYPMTLVMTSDNDERAVPFHSYKFVAKLQNNPGQTNPILLRVQKNAGHYGGGTDEEDADFYATILNVLDN